MARAVTSVDEVMSVKMNITRWTINIDKVENDKAKTSRINFFKLLDRLPNTEVSVLVFTIFLPLLIAGF